MQYTPYLNLKGSINAAVADRQRRDLQEMFRALTIAGNVTTSTEEIIERFLDGSLGDIYHADAIQAEMVLRVHDAVELDRWITDTLEMYPDDYSDWVEETQSLRHGG